MKGRERDGSKDRRGENGDKKGKKVGRERERKVGLREEGREKLRLKG